MSKLLFEERGERGGRERNGTRKLYFTRIVVYFQSETRLKLVEKEREGEKVTQNEVSYSLPLLIAAINEHPGSHFHVSVDGG